MDHDEIAELLGAYALDAVDGPERALVADHLARCARCRAEVAEHREVAALLAQGGTAAPEGLWTKISSALEEPPPRLRLVPEGDAPGRPGRPPLAWLAAAAAVVAIAGLGYQVRSQGDRIDELQASVADPVGAAFEHALDAEGSRVVELASADGEVQARAVLAGDGTGFLDAAALAPLGPGLTYQLWGIGGPDPVSLGVLGPDPSVARFDGTAFAAIAVTAEPAPGVVAPTTEPVALVTLT